MLRQPLFYVLMILSLAVTGCGGGSSSTGSGSSTDTGTSSPSVAAPEVVSGSYSGSWEGSGTNAAGTFVCSGQFGMVLSQSGTDLDVTLSLLTGTGECNDFFEVSGFGTYLSSTGELTFSASVGENTISVVGTATEQNGTITFAGRWSATNSASNIVVASGTWTAESL